MTIDEAIEKLKISAKQNRRSRVCYCIEKAEEQEQIAEWLEKLKAIEENTVFYSSRPIEDIVLEAMADAIDEFAKLIHKELYQLNHHQVDFLAEQLKERMND